MGAEDERPVEKEIIDVDLKALAEGIDIGGEVVVVGAVIPTAVGGGTEVGSGEVVVAGERGGDGGRAGGCALESEGDFIGGGEARACDSALTLGVLVGCEEKERSRACTGIVGTMDGDEDSAVGAGTEVGGGVMVVAGERGGGQFVKVC